MQRLREMAPKLTKPKAMDQKRSSLGKQGTGVITSSSSLRVASRAVPVLASALVRHASAKQLGWLLRRLCDDDLATKAGIRSAAVTITYPGEFMSPGDAAALLDGIMESQPSSTDAELASKASHVAVKAAGAPDASAQDEALLERVYDSRLRFELVGSSLDLLRVKHSSAVRGQATRILVVNLWPAAVMRKQHKLFHPAWEGYRELMTQAFDEAPRMSTFVYSLRGYLKSLLEQLETPDVSRILWNRLRSVEDVCFINTIV